MELLSTHFLVIATLAFQSVGAISVEQNVTICNWARLRAGVVRDAIYLDGGLLWWQTAFADGTAPVVSSDGNMAGDMFRLNLSTPFDTTSTNLSALLEQMPKAGGAGNNIAPNYVDGTMMVNYDELYLYGGLPRLTDSASAQSADSILGYEAYQYGPQRDSWSPGFYQGSLSDGVTRYVTNGAGTSAPSENLGFYFSGMRSPDWGPIYYEDSSANVTANTLIEVDLSTMRSEQWSNSTLPYDITPRANAELVWLPVSKRGVLLAIGGVAAPEEIWAVGLNNSQSSESKEISPSFMTSIPIYDVASKEWYLQNTTGDAHPPQLTEFCSVVAADNDLSFNIFIYGGYDGLNAADEPSDDVWVLSVPAFTWNKVYSGTTSHGRSGHQCIAPYPDKMFVIGGVHQNQANCVEGGFIQVFNLNTLEFQNDYDPNTWDEYKPSAGLASSNRKDKRQVVWSNPALAGIFSTKYLNSNKMQHFYPYKSDNSDGSSPDSGSSHGRNNTVIIAVGVAAGIVALILIIVMILIFRRRQILKSSTSESSAAKHSRISRWVLGAGPSPTRLSKCKHNDSTSSLAPEVQQVPYIATHPPSGPPTPDFRITSPPHHRYQREPSEMSASVERPLPPFEMATPYNNLTHPRTSGVVDYAYNAQQGHSPSHSHNSSNSSDYNQDPVEEHSPINSNTHLHVPSELPPAQAPSYRTSSTSSTTSSTPAWPFPSSKPSWTRQPSDEQRQSQTLHPPMPSMPPQYRSVSSGEPDRLRPMMPDGHSSDNSAYSTNPSTNKVSSISSDTNARDTAESSLPSPEGSLPPHGKYGDEYRQSLMSAMSPVSPEEPTRHWGMESSATESQRERRPSRGEGREGWWR